MAILGQGAGADYPVSIDSAEQQVDGPSGTVVDANWGNDVTDAIVKIETELGAAVKGSAASLLARLAKSLASSGCLNSGTTANRPASPTIGQPYWDTTLGQLIVHNGTTWISVAGVTDHGGLTGLGDDDHTIYILVDGSRTFTGDVAIENSIPYLQLKGTEGSGGIYAIKENAGVFYISKNTGTIAVPVWVDLVSVSSAGVITAIADNIVGYDTGNSMEVSLKAHASRHKMAGTDPINYLQLGGYVGTGCPQTSNVYIGLALFPIYAPSGTKTYYIKSNMWDAGGGGVGVSARFSILGESAASAALDTLSTASATIVSGSFSSTGAGWQTLYIEVKTNDINANGRIETFYVYTN